MKVTIFFWLWILSVCCVFSCTDEDQGLDNIISDVATAPVKLSLGMTPMQENGSMTRVCGENSLDLVLGEEMGKVADSAETRAETFADAQENVVNDICVFQFADSDGKLKYSEYIQLTSSKLTADISLAAGVGVCTVYVLVNVGELTKDVASGSTLANFKNLAAEVSSGKGSGQNLPMCGYKTNFDSETDNASLSVTLFRSVAKVSLNLTTPNTGDVFSVTSIKLVNVAKKLYYAKSSTTAPVAADLTTYASDNSKSIVWYIPENKAGSNAVTDWKDRYEENAPATATHILIEGRYTPRGGTIRDVAYTIYLGAGDKAGDFNVVRNTKYSVNAAIKGTNMNDGRVLLGRDLSAAGTQTANCYVVKTTDSNKWYRFKATIRGNGAETPAQISYTGAVIPAKDKIAPTNAALVWETREGGTKSTLEFISYSKNGYIVFKLGSASEGNAVVAARNGTTILWSWHIWTTAAFDRDGIKVQTYETRPRNGVAGYVDITKRQFKMMDRHLGAASGAATKIEAEAIKTYGLYFQFGRKDPFPAAGVMTRTNDADIIPAYDVNGNKILKNTNQTKNSTITTGVDPIAVKAQLAYAVQTPLMFIIRDDGDRAVSYNGDGTNPSYNWIFAAHSQTTPWKASNKLWGSGLQNETTSSILGTIVDVKKTIYDPCPFGYHMPPHDVWTNFTTGTTAYNTSTVAEYNVVAADKYNQSIDAIGFMDAGFGVWGRRFFTIGEEETTDMDGVSNVAFYPAAGARDGYDGLINAVGWGCSAWSAAPYAATSQVGGFLITRPHWVFAVGNAVRSSAFPVRCIRN